MLSCANKYSLKEKMKMITILFLMKEERKKREKTFRFKHDWFK